MDDHTHCRNLLGSLSDFIDGDLEAEICSEIERHISECDNCRVVVNTMRRTVDLYQQTQADLELPDGVRERLFYRLNLEDFLTGKKLPKE